MPRGSMERRSTRDGVRAGRGNAATLITCLFVTPDLIRDPLLPSVAKKKRGPGSSPGRRTRRWLRELEVLNAMTFAASLVFDVVDARTSVIASGAKQSSAGSGRPGLLRYARDDVKLSNMAGKYLTDHATCR
ncbi:hypothetical protein SPHINGO8AM_30498 [Sphingomonas sp. 8AM]|nr:hypothetical protein SPHINGO8AM_30498 [Sphingomonas sp. 8AM]